MSNPATIHNTFQGLVSSYGEMLQAELDRSATLSAELEATKAIVTEKDNLLQETEKQLKLLQAAVLAPAPEKQ